jgi:hypothetical protein
MIIVLLTCLIHCPKRRDDGVAGDERLTRMAVVG